MLEICWAFASSIFESQQHLAGSSAQFSSSGTSGPYVLVLGSTCICLALCMNPFHITPTTPPPFLTHYHSLATQSWPYSGAATAKTNAKSNAGNHKKNGNGNENILQAQSYDYFFFFFRLHIQYQYWTLIVHFQFNQSWHFATLIYVHICILYHHHIYTIYTRQTALKVASFKSHKIQLNNVRGKKLKRESKKRKENRGENCFSSARGKINENFMKAKDFKNLLRWPLCERCPTLHWAVWCGE